MNKKTLTIAAIITAFTLSLLILTVNASITVDDKVHFGYWNGSQIINPGTYASIERNNVTDQWLFDGSVYPMTAVSTGYLQFIFLIFLVCINFVLIAWPKVPILGFIISIVTFAVVATIGSDSTGMPYYPLPSVLLGFIALVLLFRSGLAWRSQ